MPEKDTKNSKDAKTDVGWPRTFIIKGTDFKFKGKRYPEGSEVEMTKEEHDREKGKLTLTLKPKKGGK
jgi:hypothetical protein